MFCSANEEKVDCCRDNPMAEIVRVRVETPPDCPGLSETPAVCMGVAEMPSV